MLTDKGYKLEKKDRIVGMSRFDEKIPLEVVFDKSYLVEYFERAVFSKLQITEWNQIQGILSEAWKVYRDKLKS